jgi:hypothetical protein
MLSIKPQLFDPLPRLVQIATRLLKEQLRAAAWQGRMFPIPL